MPVPPPNRPSLQATKYTPRRPLIKVCGLTRPADIAACMEQGVQYLGVNRHAPSPRCVPEGSVRALLNLIPEGRRVYVAVAPHLPDLAMAESQGFDIFQIHFDPNTVSESVVRLWSECVGAKRLWLAPRLSGASAFPSHLLRHASAFLVDGYSPEAYGGTGKTADWTGVAALKSMHADKTWIVAGGLGPANILDAARASHADILDLNSGIEDAPGLKSADKLRAALAALDIAFPQTDAAPGITPAQNAPTRPTPGRLKLNP